FGAVLATAAFAQRVEPGRPRTIIVGTSRAFSPTDRVDARRSGFSRTNLPTGALRAAYRHSFGQSIEHAPLVLDDGSIVVVVNHNELVTLEPGGVPASPDFQRRAPRFVASLGGNALGPPTALADGTIVAVNSAGEAVGVRQGVVRFRTRL